MPPGMHKVIQARALWMGWFTLVAAACTQAQPNASDEAGAGRGNQIRRQAAETRSTPPCIDVSSQTARVTLTGRLDVSTSTTEGLAGPPERVFILDVPQPICIRDGGDFADPAVRFSSVQIGFANDAVLRRLRGSLGRTVTVSGEGFAAQTAHHYRPLVVMADAVASPGGQSPAPRARAFDPLATARSFYMSLGAGRYEAAASLIVPRKRASGPLSAPAMARYYSTFERPLRLLRASRVGSGSVIAAYDYVLPGGRICRGEAVVDLEPGGDGAALIERIRTVGGC
jgi:hypothetical protein